jgi:hypothetical protein
MYYRFNEASLLVKGVVFDEIDGFSGVRHWGDDEKNDTNFVNTRYDANPYGDDEALTKALWYTLVGGRNAQGGPASDALACVLDETILDSCCAPPFEYTEGDTDASLSWNMHLWWKRNAEFKLNGRHLKRHLKYRGVSQRDPKSYFDALARMSRFFWSRRLIVTRSGYVGIASRTVRRGDSIVIIGGCSAPLVLRTKLSLSRANDLSYEILGECFIYGFMNGEILRSVKGRSRVIEDLSLI